ncbi:MAG: ATP-binding protein [Solobacterium sp.]|nr:ATP-binding protein [Solobacterium sp.]
MIYGGLPYILNRKTEEQKSDYLKNLFNETYLKDILEHNRMKGAAELGELIDILASSVGSLANPSRIANTFESVKKVKIAKETIRNYISYLEDAYLISDTKRYDVKGRRYIDTPLKYYFEDVGLRNARLNFRQLEEPHLMENIIYNELRYRGYNIDVGVVEINERENDKYLRKQLEIDFIANKGSKKYYIQVAQGVSDPGKREQETRSLRKIRDGFKKVLIRKDNGITFTDEDGILNLYLFDFLFDRKTLDD